MAAPNEENILSPFCPEKEQRKRNDPNGGRWSPQLNTFSASVLRYPAIAHSKAAPRFVAYPAASRFRSSHHIRAGSCITQLNDVAFFVMGGNLILCEARPSLCFCKPINSVLRLAYCKLSAQLSLRPELHNLLHELHSAV